jgi:MFS family permease
MLSPGFVEIAGNLNISVPVLGQSTAWLILCIGLGLFITNPLAKIIGRRPVYLVAIAIMFATSIWGAAVRDYNSFLGSRIVAGIGMAPYEVLVQCTIGDIYFVHERATRIAVWNLFLLTGISGGALVAGYIIERDGYQWTFWVCAIFFGVLMVAFFFLVPETAYRRKAVVVGPTGVKEEGGDGSIGLEKTGPEHDVNSVDDKEKSAEAQAVPKKHTYLQSLRIYTGRYSRAPGWKPFARPVVMLFYPAVFWGFLVYGEHLPQAPFYRH